MCDELLSVWRCEAFVGFVAQPALCRDVQSVDLLGFGPSTSGQTKGQSSSQQP